MENCTPSCHILGKEWHGIWCRQGSARAHHSSRETRCSRPHEGHLILPYRWMETGIQRWTASNVHCKFTFIHLLYSIRLIIPTRRGYRGKLTQQICLRPLHCFLSHPLVDPFLSANASALGIFTSIRIITPMHREVGRMNISWPGDYMLIFCCRQPKRPFKRIQLLGRRTCARRARRWQEAISRCGWFSRWVTVSEALNAKVR